MAILEVKNVFKGYATHQALMDVSMDIPEGSIFGLLGPNGAGKTSLIRIINQITGPDSGEIRFKKRPLQRSDVRHIGYLPEERGLYRKMKVGEQALYLAQLRGMNRHEAERALKEWFERFDIGSWWDKKVDDLSKGMAQKVQFVTTVVHGPQFIVLDEPFSGFDPINARLIKSELLRLNSEGATIMLSTHNMASVEEICTHIALINHSRKVLDGEVRTIRNRFKEGMYDISFKGQMIGFTNALWAGFELVSHSTEAEVHTARVKLLNKHTVNDLLRVSLDTVEIISINEVIPGMNDIFITAVQAKEEDHE